MGDWKGYISAVCFRDQRIDDVAIAGHSDNQAGRARGLGPAGEAIHRRRWVCSPGQTGHLPAGGAVRGGPPLLRQSADHLLAEGDGVLDARTKGLDGRAICVPHARRCSCLRPAGRAWGHSQQDDARADPSGCACRAP